MKFNTDSFPSSLPMWIRDWAVACRDHSPGSESDLYILPEEDLECLWKILCNGEIATKLAKLCRQPGPADSAMRDAIVELLAVTCSSFRRAQMQPKLSSAALERKLRSLADSARQLALTANEFHDVLHDGLSTRYLKERVHSKQPVGFARLKRGGLRKGHFLLDYADDPTLIDLLLAFADDINEEIANRRQFDVKADGGEGGAVRYQIRRVKSVAQRIFGRADNGLIAALLTAANGEVVDEERVKKTRVGKGKNRP